MRHQARVAEAVVTKESPGVGEELVTQLAGHSLPLLTHLAVGHLEKGNEVSMFVRAVSFSSCCFQGNVDLHKASVST